MTAQVEQVVGDPDPVEVEPPAVADPAHLQALLETILRTGEVRTHFQPIVELESESIVAFEALSRGPAGPLEFPDQLFDTARRGGRLAELDQLCRREAVKNAVLAGVLTPLTLFVNVEPEVLETGSLDDLVALAEGAGAPMSVVLEITERSIAARPAELLDTVVRLRRAGWRIALDDVGADDMSLAFMPLLQPDIVKLDLRLVQQRPGPAVVEIMNAVNAYAERSGALLLAEGIEDDEHLRIARALGARLGQGWKYGRPAPVPADGPRKQLQLCPPAATTLYPSPFHCLPPGTDLRVSTKSLLIEFSKLLEREAMRLGKTCTVVATFQDARHFTPSTGDRYRQLADRVGFVAALGTGLGPQPVRGVRGANLDPDDEIRSEWDITVLAPHFSAALLARDLGDPGPDLERRFEFALTYERKTVADAAHSLMSRVVATPAAPSTAELDLPPYQAGVSDRVSDVSLRRALSATGNGVAIADATHPDFPLVYVNPAFERLSGMRAEQVLGRNCRFMQSPDTDRAAVGRIREALRAGREIRETIVNVRYPDNTPWWNEIYLAPVFDDDGRLVQYVGIQSDVTARVQAEHQLREEQQRSADYLATMESLAFRDPLTGLRNRRNLRSLLQNALDEAATSGTAVALLYLDLDDFKSVNDLYGHAAGDVVLETIADRLRDLFRTDGLLARLGGDEFLAVVTKLELATAEEEVRRLAGECLRVASRPIRVDGTDLVSTASLGISISPMHGSDFDTLLHAADQRMYAGKARSRCRG